MSTELDYKQSTSALTVTSTNAAAMDTLLTCSALSFDGATPVYVEISCPWWGTTGSAQNLFLHLFIDGANYQRFWDGHPSALGIQMPGFSAGMWITPTAGSHTLSLRGYTNAGATQLFEGGPGGSGAELPCFMRVTTAGGIELAYVEATSDAAITATTEGTSATILTLPSITVDGSTVVLLEYGCPAWSASATANTGRILSYLDGTVQGAMWIGRAHTANAYIGGFVVQHRLTPAAGSHTFTIRSFTSAGTLTFRAGAGGSGSTFVPMYARVVAA